MAAAELDPFDEAWVEDLVERVKAHGAAVGILREPAYLWCRGIWELPMALREEFYRYYREIQTYLGVKVSDREETSGGDARTEEIIPAPETPGTGGDGRAPRSSPRASDPGAAGDRRPAPASPASAASSAPTLPGLPTRLVPGRRGS